LKKNHGYLTKYKIKPRKLLLKLYDAKGKRVAMGTFQPKKKIWDEKNIL